jgi:lipopolysaccharide/colanic/teichoic acid biosynthesis glycosyltransferase
MNRVTDAVIAGVLLAFTLPLMIIVAAAISFDSPGPVLEREPRVGRCERRFNMLQFRTNVCAPEDAAPVWLARRVTRVGAFLRYTRIESLPRLLNVLLGDMSLVEIDEGLPSFLK